MERIYVQKLIPYKSPFLFYFLKKKDLLRIFGIPFIVAPMEAEAQCAQLNISGHVEAIITEDCDVLLFGGRTVFKNIFDDRRYVETYRMDDVASELGLSREKLVNIALLLGSDYTQGIRSTLPPNFTPIYLQFYPHFLPTAELE